MHRALLVLAGAVFASAQQPSQSQPSHSPAFGNIAGRILCADTHAPARFARVSLVSLGDDWDEDDEGTDRMLPGSGATAVTDLDGAFVIPLVPRGTYTWQVDFPGYVDPLSMAEQPDLANPDPQIQARLRSLLHTVTVRESETASAQVSLHRGAAVSGKVLFEDGTPATGLAIRPVDVASLPGKGANRLFLSRASLTDDQGRFRISGLPAGEYVIGVNLYLWRSTAEQNSYEMQTVYAPGSFRRKNAAVITVAAAEEKADVTITIPIGGMHAVMGTVVQRANGMRVTGGDVQLLDPQDPSFVLNGLIASDGSFRIDFVPPGQFTLRVAHAYESWSHDIPNVTSQGSPTIDVVHRTTPFIQLINHFYGTVEQRLTVTSDDVTGITLQVPELDDPTMPPPVPN